MTLDFQTLDMVPDQITVRKQTKNKPNTYVYIFIN